MNERVQQKTQQINRQKNYEMIKFIKGISIAGTIMLSFCVNSRTSASLASSDAVPTSINKKVDQVEILHGRSISDPYRWLESSDSDMTREWINKQNSLTREFIDSIECRSSIRERLASLWNYEKVSIPFRKANKLLYFRNQGLQNQDVLYYQVLETSQDGCLSKEFRLDHEKSRVLLDPNQLAPDGTISLSGLAVSEDGRYLAYGISKSGSDWQEWRVRDIDSGKDLDDRINWVKFSGASWSKDNKGFFYSRYDEPNENESPESRNFHQKLYFHELGDKQSADRLIYERKDKKEWGFSGNVSEDGKYLIIHVWEGTEPKNRIFVKSLTNPGSPVRELFSRADAKYEYIWSKNDEAWFLTDLKAPMGKIIKANLMDTDNREPAIIEIVGEKKEALENVTACGGKLFAQYLENAYSKIIEFELDGTEPRTISLPGIGTVSGFRGKEQDQTVFFQYTSFDTPASIWKYSITDGSSTVLYRPSIEFDPDEYITKQVFVTSKDGTKVPLFLTARKVEGRFPDGLEKPCYLYGYGGFNISMVPAFSVAMLQWMELGGIYAQACLRGGGEYGEEWHLAGTKSRKQNVFDDFIACAEWLNDKRITSRKKLAIAGGSNGGLLVGACLTQRPDLFGAACPAVGVMDMLRFHKFTIGWGWVSDYGSPDNEEDFLNLLAYSPLHNLRKGEIYPATLITTADHDDRVVPAHSFKFAAGLQEAQGGSAPILIRIETKAGHGAGKPTSKLIDEWADKFAFLARVLDFEEEVISRLATRNMH